jgi:hypothetical protein
MKEEPKTLSVPAAGKLYFDLGKNASYEAAKRGEIPVIRIGSRLRVPIVALERMLERAGSPIAPDDAFPQPFPDPSKMGLYRNPNQPHPPVAGKRTPIDSKRYQTRNKFDQKSNAPECPSVTPEGRIAPATGGAA